MQPDPDWKNSDHDAKWRSEQKWRKQQAETERREVTESRRRYEEGEALAAKQLEASKKKGAAERSFAEAVGFARSQIKSDGLAGEIRPYGEIRYTVAQGLKAAVHGREDGIASLVLQRQILMRLDSIKSLLWVAIAVLGFIAYRVV